MNEQLRKIQQWSSRKAGQALEISQDLSRAARKMAHTIRDAAPAPKPRKTQKSDSFPGHKAPPVRGEPEGRSAELTQAMEIAIHRAYFREGGFRYFSLKLCRYIALVLPTETDPHRIWAGAFNSCMVPLLRQTEKLNAELESLCAGADHAPEAPENRQLLALMRSFSARILSDGFAPEEGWDPEEYRKNLIRYGDDLQHQLLQIYRPEQD